MKIRIIAFICMGAVLFASCKKEFLNEDPYNEVPADAAITSESSMQTAVYGMYAQLRNANLYGRTIPLIGDLLADNLFISSSNSNRYIAEFNYNYTNTNANASATWGAAYVAILRANNIINANLPESPIVNQLKGEAKTVRALMYFVLVNYYAKQFSVDPNADGVPLVLDYDPQRRPARNKVSEVYAQIEKDLSEAFTQMTNTTKNTSFVTKYVAKALSARVSLFKGDWAGARDNALSVVTGGGYTLADSATYVNYWRDPAPRTNKIETIFEVASDNVNNNGTNALSYFFDQTGYGDAIASDDFYNKFRATDVRRQLFLNGTRASQAVKIVNKYPNTNTVADKDDTKVIRYSEVLLTLAEAYYRLNDEANALLYLNQVAKRREPSFAGYASTGAQLLEDILLERRKELAFEGMRYLDLLRLNRDVTRVNINNNYIGVTPLTLAATSNKRIYPIPQDERDANPNISQNPGY
jgi:starch-binding outer membrane protein, SusD/RagB family